MTMNNLKICRIQYEFNYGTNYDTVYVYGTAGSAAQAYCNDPTNTNCVFVPDTGN